MNEFILVFGIAALAGFLTYLGAPLAERFDVGQRIVSAALQFAAGVITALVALTLMPPAARGGPPIAVAIMFFIGGAIYVAFEYYSAQKMASRAAESGTNVTSIGLYVGILVDLVIDGIVIGVGATLTLMTGLLLALGMAISTLPLAFVTTSTAKRQGISPRNRQRLSIAYFLCVLGGAMLGFFLLQDAPLGLRLALISLASGFLITTVTQSMIPEANKEGEPSFAGMLYLAGLSLYAILTLTVK